jgi:hypothetical protein
MSHSGGGGMRRAGGGGGGGYGRGWTGEPILYSDPDPDVIVDAVPVVVVATPVAAQPTLTYVPFWQRLKATPLGAMVLGGGR